MVSRVQRYFLEIKDFSKLIDLNLPENHKIILDDKKDFFKSNNRMGMMLNLLRKISPEELAAIKTRAYEIIANPDAY